MGDPASARKVLSLELLDLSERLIVKAQDNKGSSGCIRERLIGPWPKATEKKKSETEVDQSGLLPLLKQRMKAAIDLMLDTRGHLGQVIVDLDLHDSDLELPKEEKSE